MPQGYIIKTVTQYSSRPVSNGEMEQLCEIARDYCTVKNIVFERYGGIHSFSKLYPGYTIQNEMTDSGIRREMGLPSVYFYLAIFDALGNIKSEWTRLKSCILKNINNNPNFSSEDRHYLRFVMKTDQIFGAVLTGEEAILPEVYMEKYKFLQAQTDSRRLDHYLRRQTRKYHKILHSTVNDGFSVSSRAYRYADHGIYITTKKRRGRVFIPLTDNNHYNSQLYIKLFLQEGKLEIKAPIQRKVEYCENYTAEVGIALGMWTMLTTNQGNTYGTAFGDYQVNYADWIRQKSIVHKQNIDFGRKKYNAQKNRWTEKLHSYINHELNVFFANEKPRRIYMVRLPKQGNHYGSKSINHSVSMWQKGYIRKRLIQKCAEQSVELVEVLGKNISQECSCCGSFGDRKEGIFRCSVCGFSVKEKQNTAANVLKRGQLGQIFF